MDVNIELQPDVDDQNLDAALTAAADAVGDDMAGMPGLDDMPSLEDDNGMPSLEESSTNSPPTQHISGASGALPAELANGGAASLLLPSEVMNPQNLAGIRQHFNPNNMMKMRDQMKFMNPQMIMQMQQSLKKMTPQQRMAMQQQMRTVAQNLPPGEFDEIQRIAKENAQVLLKAQETGESKESIASKMQLPAMQKPKAAVPQKSGHGHSHGGKECGHDHGKPQNSFTELLKKDTAAVIKAAKADLNRKFVQKSHIVYECPRCSLEAPATYPMVVYTSRCNQCGQYISLPLLNPLPRERAVRSPLSAQQLVLKDVKTHLDPNLFQYIELGEFHGFEDAIMSGASAEIRLPGNDNPTLLHWAVAKFAGDLRFVELLLRHPDVDVDARTNQHNQTPLQLASYYGLTAVVQILLAGKANMHLVDKSNWTVIHQAAKSGATFLIDLFHRGGVSLHAKDENGRTALHWAAYHNHVDTIRWLLDRGLDIMERDVEQCIPLHWATLRGNIPAIDTLLRYSHTQAQLEAKDETGEDANGLAADKELRVEEPDRKQLYQHVAKTVRGYGVEQGWRRRLCLASRDSTAGLPAQQSDTIYKLAFIIEVASVAYTYYKHVFWLTSHYTVATMLFNVLLLVVVLLWVQLRSMDPGYITQPKGGSDKHGSAEKTLAREIVPTLPSHFGILKRLYDESLRCVPRAYGRVDAREGIIIPVRARRCPVTERIVLNYQAHCHWIGVPVGLRNMRAVTAFCVAVSLLIPTWIVLGWVYITSLTPSEESVFTNNSFFVLWLAHFGFLAYSALKNANVLFNSAFLNATVQEISFPAANPHMVVRSNQHGMAWNNPFNRGFKTNFQRFLTGANIMDVPLPPASCNEPKEEV